MFIKGFLSNSFGILISRILGLIRDLLSAFILGAGLYSDIFFIAFKLPNLFRRIFAEGAFSQAFLPNFIKSNKKSIFSAQSFLIFIFLIIILTLGLNLFTDFFIKLMASGLDDEKIKLAEPLVRINFYYLGLIFCVSFIASLLQYKDHFLTTAFSTSLLNLSMIVSLILAKHQDQASIALYLSFGVVIGGILQLLLHLMALKITKMDKIFFGGFKYFFKGKREKMKDFFVNFYHSFLAQSTMQISAFMDTWLASFLASGFISYMFYANRIFQLPLAIFSIAMSQALFPKISKFLKNGMKKKANDFANKGFEFLFLSLSMASIGGIILSEFIIEILFQRGKFTHENTLQTAMILKAYLIGLVPFGINKFLSVWIFASLQQKKAFKISIATLVINFILAIVLMQYFSASGIALASSLSGFISLILYIRVFGYRNFLDIIKIKRLVVISFILIIFAVCLNYIKGILNVYF